MRLAALGRNRATLLVRRIADGLRPGVTAGLRPGVADGLLAARVAALLRLLRMTAGLLAGVAARVSVGLLNGTTARVANGLLAGVAAGVAVVLLAGVAARLRLRPVTARRPTGVTAVLAGVTAVLVGVTTLVGRWVAARLRPGVAAGLPRGVTATVRLAVAAGRPAGVAAGRLPARVAGVWRLPGMAAGVAPALLGLLWMTAGIAAAVLAGMAALLARRMVIRLLRARMAALGRRVGTTPRRRGVGISRRVRHRAAPVERSGTGDVIHARSAAAAPKADR
ncbi:hypothetical protein [Micromonospora sp. NPDC023737]|uniref:hypothetical protein n=1 Tax=unclassified Micromonospora TaxID=2617518 RepID=UPI0033DC97B8